MAVHSSLRAKIIEILADGHFHSGEELGNVLGVTRSAIWKTVNQLADLGISVSSVKGKGYQIPNGIELLDKAKILAVLQPATRQHLHTIDINDSINSTNQFLLDQVKTGAKSGYVCIAEHQRQGRGRRGRQWQSPFGTNLYFSLLWSFNKDPAEIAGLSLIMGVAIIRTLHKFGAKDIGLKWPNDVLWQQRKLGGVLVEIVAESHSQTQVVIGVGINLNMPSEIVIDQPWVDLQTLIGHRPPRNQIMGELLNEIIQVLEAFDKNGLKSFLQEWEQYDCVIGKEVKMQFPQSTIDGEALGISEKGELILKDVHNNVHRFLSGEVSLRLHNPN